MGKITHGFTRVDDKRGIRIFQVWRNMMSRCYDQEHLYYARYGGRGITVCERWLKFENFYADMGEPMMGMTLERINNELGYSKENCRWATKKEQANNRSNNRLLEIDGKKRTMAEWCTEYGLKPSTVWTRLERHKWTVERALKTPARRMRS